MVPCIDQHREVRLYGRRVGEIERLALHALAFRYDAGYAQTPDMPPLSNSMPTKMKEISTTRASAWFEGLLPEEMRRTQLARIVGTTRIDTWSLLDAAGADCAGAVQIVNPAYEERPALHRLTPDELAKLVLTTPVEPIGTVDRSARVSIAGAQDKVALTMDSSGEWSVPLAGAPSTHILKPQSRRFPRLVENEHWCMKIARQAGVSAAYTTVITAGETPVLVVERYDRQPKPNAPPERIHQEDMAQALGTTRKYQGDGGPSLAEIARVHGVHGEELLKRVVLNWIMGNADGHAKNLSVLEPGTERARLAPAYDVLCSETYPGIPVELAIGIGDATQPGEVDSANIVKGAQAIGVDPESALETVSSLGTAIAEAAHDESIEPYGLRITVRDLVRHRAERASREFNTPGREPRRAAGHGEGSGR